jgi:hypothetical protein
MALPRTASGNYVKILLKNKQGMVKLFSSRLWGPDLGSTASSELKLFNAAIEHMYYCVQYRLRGCQFLCAPPFCIHVRLAEACSLHSPNKKWGCSQKDYSIYIHRV